MNEPTINSEKAKDVANIEEEILGIVEAALTELTDEFIRKPMRFFSEKDFHWYFCCILRDFLLKKDLIKTQFNDYKTMIVHQEYGCPNGMKKQMDVVVLNPQEVGGINDYDLKRDGKFLPALVAVEFSTEKKGDSREDIEKDCQKLIECNVKKGYIAIYYRDYTKSKEGRRYHEHRQKVLKVKEEIKNAWKEYSVKYGLKFKCAIRYINLQDDGIVYELFENGEWKQYQTLQTCSGS